MPDVIALHLRHLELLGRAPETIACRRRALTRMQQLLGVPLLEASGEDLAVWRATLNVGPGTVAGYVSHARSFYEWARLTCRYDGNPAAGLPVPKQGRTLPRPITEADLLAAVTGAPPRIRPWLVLAAYAGLRAKEIALLRRECVRETARPPALLIALSATKGHRERVVPLSRFCLGELLDHGLPRSGYVFRRADGLPGPNTPSRVSQVANNWLRGAGIDATLHQLRHRFGTQVYAVDHDLRLTQELLGHARPSTTAGYAAWDQASAAATVEALPAPGCLRAVTG